MNEHSFVRSINTKIRPHLHVWKIDANAANGVPDCWYSGNGGDVWVEYKYQDARPYTLSRLQNDWLTSRHNEGRRCWLVVGTPDGVYVCDKPPYAEKLPLERSFYSVAQYTQLLIATCKSGLL